MRTEADIEGTDGESAEVLPHFCGTARSRAVLFAAQRITARIALDNAECWIWPGAKVRKGYGVLSCSALGRGTYYTHRVMYEYAHGPIPDGAQIDHLCRAPSCCNPAHLEAVSPSENTLRGRSPALAKARARAIIACPYGHPYDAENTVIDKRGGRSCRQCRKRRHAEWSDKRRSRLTPALQRSMGGE